MSVTGQGSVLASAVTVSMPMPGPPQVGRLYCWPFWPHEANVTNIVATKAMIDMILFIFIQYFDCAKIGKNSGLRNEIPGKSINFAVLLGG